MHWRGGCVILILPPASFLILSLQQWVEGRVWAPCVCVYTSAVYTTGSEKCLVYPAPQINEHQNPLKACWSTACWAPPRVSDSGGLGWCLTICISDKFPGDAEAAPPGTTRWQPLYQRIETFHPFNNETEIEPLLAVIVGKNDWLVFRYTEKRVEYFFDIDSHHYDYSLSWLVVIGGISRTPLRLAQAVGVVGLCFYFLLLFPPGQAVSLMLAPVAVAFIPVWSLFKKLSP